MKQALKSICERLNNKGTIISLAVLIVSLSGIIEGVASQCLMII